MNRPASNMDNPAGCATPELRKFYPRPSENCQIPVDPTEFIGIYRGRSNGLFHTRSNRLYGQVAEWFKAHAWNACVRESVPWVRIPPCPPLASRLPFDPDPLSRVRCFTTLATICSPDLLEIVRPTSAHDRCRPQGLAAGRDLTRHHPTGHADTAPMVRRTVSA